MGEEGAAVDDRRLDRVRRLAMIDVVELPMIAITDRPSADDDLHVMPTYGREHETSSACWCHPTVDPPTRRWQRRVWIHREAN